jgi:K319L-like, PKD domain
VAADNHGTGTADNVANTTPVANAGPDQAVASAAPVQLTGAGSSDADHDQLTYQWTQTAGPSEHERIPPMRYRTCLCLGMLALATVAIAAFSSAQNREARGDAQKREQYPELAVLLSKNERVRTKAMVKYVLANRALVAELIETIVSREKRDTSKVQLANACYLLGKLRTDNPDAIAALLSAVDADFLPKLMLRIPFGQSNPQEALVYIGKPAVRPVLEALAKEKAKKRIEALRWVLNAIEGPECAIVRINTFLDEEKSPERKALLRESREYFVEKKQQERATRK